RVGGEARHPRPAGIPADARPREVPRPQDVVRDLERAGMLPAIYFLFSRRACELQATDCAALDLFGDREARRARRERIDAYLALLEPEDRELEQVQRLSALLARGIAFHHAGVLPMLKGLVEELFAAGLIGVVFATETLALGINMPARSVVIAEQTKFDGESRRPLIPNEYSQLVGRAGRRGLDPLGYAVTLYSPWVSCDEVVQLITGDLLPIRSGFTPRYNTVAALWDGSVAARDRLVRLFASSLRQFQMNDDLKGAAAEVEGLRAAAEELHFACPYEGVPDAALVEYIGLRRTLGDMQKRVRRSAGERQAGAARDLADFEATLERHPCHRCPIRSDHERSLRREGAALRDLAHAEATAAELEGAAASQAQRTLDALTGVLGRFGFLAAAKTNGAAGPRPEIGGMGTSPPSAVAATAEKAPSAVAATAEDSSAAAIDLPALPRPTDKMAVLARVYDANGLLLIDLVWGGLFDQLLPAELMEALSWFCYDREGPRWNRLQLTTRLTQLRPRMGEVISTVRDEEARAEITITTGPNPSFSGPVLAWCRGAPFADLLDRLPVSEGDLLMALNKTLDLATQLREALRLGAPNDTNARALMAKLEAGDRLLRRGIVAQSLRLATSTPS
ncbi:MAG: hypothetical protein M3442_04015, partial [Chloroflexota bacterium]|nr:hypothetical protein [Chloroflexota bacterium]